MNGSRSKIIGRTVAVFCLGMSAVCNASNAAPVTLELKEQPLAMALRDFARQSGIQIAIQAELANGKTAPSLNGQFEPTDALAALLKGTGLVAYSVNENTYGVRPVGSKPTADAAGPEKLILLAQADQATENTENGETQETQENKTSEQQNSGRSSVEEVVVTGSNIRGIAPASSPLTIYDRKAIEQTGSSTVEGFLRTIPQNFSLINSESEGSTNNASASANQFSGASVNLRGLGAGSTLVLINGRRVPAAGTDGSFTDVSMIPLSAVERIEVLTDGASAVYGADAIAGVVNFVLRRQLEGGETGATIGDTTDGGGQEYSIAQSLGHSWSSGSGLAAFEIIRQNPVQAAERDFIVARDGPFSILPEQKRQSLFLTARNQLGSIFDISIDVLGSRRESEADQFSAPDFLTHSVTEVEQLGGALLLGAVLSGGWRAELAAEKARMDQEGTAVTSFGESALTQTLGFRSEATALNLKGDGPVFEAAGGTAKVSIGVTWRREGFEDFAAPEALGSIGSGLERDVTSAFGELFVPLVSESNRRTGIERLELSVATRYDEYEDFGSSTNPKVGVLWSPMPSVSVRGTYGKSFRAPPLASLSRNGNVVNISRLRDPLSPTGFTFTLVPGTPQNPDIHAERARFVTAGIDVEPKGLPGFDISATYFRVQYRDRLATPPVVGSNSQVFSQTETLGPFITRSPGTEAIQAFLDRAQFVFNPRNVTLPSGVQAIFDARIQNIAATDESGIELSTSLDRETRFGSFGFSLSADYLLEIEYQAASTTPIIDFVDTIYNPPRVRFKSAVSWSRGGLSSGVNAYYVDSYDNNLVTPVGSVASWTTLDAQVSYDFGDNPSWSILKQTRMFLNVQNLFDKNPPFVVSDLPLNLGYDAANASGRGRFVSMMLRKAW